VIVACQVCFRGADPLMRASLNAGILVLLGVTAVVLVCFGAFFFTLARRARASAHMTPDPISDLR
jgi:hypothetical protein